MEQKAFRRGEIIFKEGGEGGCMYQIAQGSVGIYTSYGKNGEKQLNRIKVHGKANLKKLNTILLDESFGEMSLLDGAPRSATAVAEEDTVLYEITMKDLEQWLQTNPAQVLVFLEKMSGNLRGLTKNYMAACGVLAQAEEAERTKTAMSRETEDGIRTFSEEYGRMAKA